MKISLLILTLFCGPALYATFVPEDQILPSHLLAVGPSNTTEAEFNALIKKVQDAYAPLVQAQGGRLNISGGWREEKLNAGANQTFGSWSIKITGGLARRPELTQDGFTLILCHEMGHHMGGFAFAQNAFPFGGVWAANEGQADYFATHICSRKIWGTEASQNAEARKTASLEIRSSCDKVWADEASQNLCYRTLQAVESLTLTMAAITGKPVPHFSTPDPQVVEKTSDAHPAVQCRMDTSFQGALCSAPSNESLIPGKKVATGPHSADAEKEAAVFSCTHFSNFSIGLRPNCWFKARY